MSKIHHRKFARFFPAYHPKAGQPTYFVEKIIESFSDQFTRDWVQWELNNPFLADMDLDTETKFDPKNHTIRAGHNVKVGDFIRPSVWSGKPYASKQIIIAPDIEVKQTWDFEVDACGVIALAKPGEQLKYLDEGVDEIIARNDGLEYDDFLEWIVMPFYRKGKDSGPMQIICWSDNVEY